MERHHDKLLKRMTKIELVKYIQDLYKLVDMQRVEVYKLVEENRELVREANQLEKDENE